MLRSIYLSIILFCLHANLFAQGYSGLVGRWTFNGNANDISGNGLNGIVHDATLDTGVNGIPNTAYRFNGSSSTITIPYNSMMNTKIHSFCALVKPTAFYSASCQGNAIIWRGAQFGGSFSYHLEIFDNAYDNSDGIFSPTQEVFAGWTGQSTSSTPQTEWYYTPTVKLNRWYAVVLTYGGDTTKIYVDGSLVSTFYDPCTFAATTDSLSFGKSQEDPFHQYWFDGVIDEIRFYNRVLNPDEVAVFADSAASGATLPLKFYLDANNNCTRDAGEKLNTLPLLVGVDSNGIPVDTLSATSGLYYTPRAISGDIYSFHIISAAPGLFLSCPSGAVIYDTVGANSYATKYFGFSCTSSSLFDLREDASATTDKLGQTISTIIDNKYCSSVSGTLTMTFSPKFVFNSAMPSPTLVSGNNITWDLSDLSYTTSPKVIRTVLRVLGSPLTPGDTVQTRCIISPIAGDENTGDNVIVRNDTVRECHDPNEIAVVPGDCLPKLVVSPLQYTIHFENTGNDTAHNIYILDTLSPCLNSSSLSLVAASAVMDIKQYKFGDRNIVRFDFPAINLLDSSYHDQCTGFVTFNINTNGGLVPDTHIDNRAGIYFDENAVVMTNTAENDICIPTEISTIGAEPVKIYPNPTTNKLTVQCDRTVLSIAVYDYLGRQVDQESSNTNCITIDVDGLASGIYIIRINGTLFSKFLKQ